MLTLIQGCSKLSSIVILFLQKKENKNRSLKTGHDCLSTTNKANSYLGSLTSRRRMKSFASSLVLLKYSSSKS